MCSVIDGTSSGSFDTSTGTYTFHSTTDDILAFPPSDNGQYIFTITASLGSASDSFTFELNLVDPFPCMRASLTSSALGSIDYTLKEGIKTVVFNTKFVPSLPICPITYSMTIDDPAIGVTLTDDTVDFALQMN